MHLTDLVQKKVTTDMVAKVRTKMSDAARPLLEQAKTAQEKRKFECVFRTLKINLVAHNPGHEIELRIACMLKARLAHDVLLPLPWEDCLDPPLGQHAPFSV